MQDTVKYAYKEPAYMNFRLKGTDLHSQIITKVLVYDTFIKNSGHREQLFMVPHSSL